MKTYVATPSTRDRKWVVVDASDKTLGRLATQIADTLRGKRKPDYTPHCDVGDFVIVVNAAKIGVTGNKREEKRYTATPAIPAASAPGRSARCSSAGLRRSFARRSRACCPAIAWRGSSCESSRCTPDPSIRTWRRSPSSWR